MELAKIEINDLGGSPVATHNMPCAVCLKKHAVYHLDEGHFSPCWDCQRNGYDIVGPTHSKVKAWFRRMGA